MLVIKRHCEICGGDGVDKEKTGPGGDMSVPCAACKGEGHFEVDTIDVTEITDSLESLLVGVNDVSDKCDDILEKLNE